MRLFGKVAVVQWSDACSSAGWTDQDEAEKTEAVPVASFGIIVRRSRTHLVLAHGVSADGQFLGLTTIPARWVKRVLIYRMPKAGRRKPKKGTGRKAKRK